MTPAPDDWSPSPELLAAYFDGELADQPEVAELEQCIGIWLQQHPEARAVFDDYRRLSQLWHDTTPAQPSPAVWRSLDAHLAALPFAPRVARQRRRVWWIAAAALTSAAAVVLALWLQWQPAPPLAPAAVDEVFPVATAAEVEILHIDGADTQTLVVGELPVGGPLELADPGEVAITSVQPDARDQATPHVRIGDGQRPMIWTRTNADVTLP
jgi:hypothetical protein